MRLRMALDVFHAELYVFKLQQIVKRFWAFTYNRKPCAVQQVDELCVCFAHVRAYFFLHCLSVATCSIIGMSHMASSGSLAREMMLI